jgi:sialidase-1
VFDRQKISPRICSALVLFCFGCLSNPSFVKTTKQVALSQYPRSGGLMGYSMRASTHRLTQWIQTNSGEIRASELYAYTGEDQPDARIEKKNLALEPEYQSTVDQLSRQLTESFGLQKIAAVRGAQDNSTNTSNETSFEKLTAGDFKSVDSEVGTWVATSGRSRIDNQHAKSGRQCLHLVGGEESVVELKVGEGAKTDGQLSFWAERWTSRSPFSFRVEKQSQGQWTEIFNGDEQVRVGRAFLSKFVIPLGDPKLSRLRFTVTSPANTGILIDDVRIEPARPQRIASVEVIPMTLPALVGNPASALLKLKIDTEGTLAPIFLTELGMTLDGTDDRQDLQFVAVYCSESSSIFSSQKQFGESLKPNDKLTFTGNQPLAEGGNYFWIAGKLNDQANLDHRVGAVCSQVTFSNGQTMELKHEPTSQRMGVAVRRSGDDGVHTFRIPGLATTNQGTLIGVYDVRHRSGGDLPGDIDVGMSRSTDGGRTWEPMKIIMDMGDDPDFRFDGIGDPTVLVDKTTGTVWCAATWSHGNRSWNGSQPGLEPEETGQFMLVKSDDDGVTWSQPINITKQVKKPEWSFLLQGPGKGITLSDGTLVFPAQYQDPPNPTNKRAHRLPHSTFIFSRDHGQSWDVATGAFDDTTEAQVIETTDGKIMINCRYNRQGKRVVMTTADRGQTWIEHPTSRRALIEPGACMASLINVGRELGRKDMATLLFANPNSPRGRSRMTIKASTDLGQTWPPQHQLLLDEQNSRGYSCLSMIDENTVGILYEGSQADMTFQRIPLVDILDGNPAAAPQSLSFERVFGDHMVLQANQPIRVWGSAKPGSAITFVAGQNAGIDDRRQSGKVAGRT